MSWAELRMIKVLFVRELLKTTKEPSRLLGIIVQPLLFWFVIGSGFMPSFRVASNTNLGYQNFFFVGVVAMVVLFSAIFSTITLIEDRASGFMQAVLVAPGKRWALVLGKVLGVAFLAMMQALLLLGVGALAGVPMDTANWVWVFIFLALGGLSLAGLGFVFAWGTSSTSAYHALMSVFLIPLWILSGAMFPPEATWMKILVLINPIAWLVAGLRAALAGGIAPVGSVTEILTLCYSFSSLLAFSCLMILLGTLICRKN